MNVYKILTLEPLEITKSVKKEMQFGRDIRDDDYKNILTRLLRKIIQYLIIKKHDNRKRSMRIDMTEFTSEINCTLLFSKFETL